MTDKSYGALQLITLSGKLPNIDITLARNKENTCNYKHNVHVRLYLNADYVAPAGQGKAFRAF